MIVYVVLTRGTSTDGFNNALLSDDEGYIPVCR